MFRLNPSDVSQSLFSLPFTKVKQDYISSGLKGKEKGRSKKNKVKSEDIYKKNKYKKCSDEELMEYIKIKIELKYNRF